MAKPKAAKRKIKKQEGRDKWPVYGARAKKWKNPVRVGGRVTRIEFRGKIGPLEHHRIAFLDRVISPKIETIERKGGRIVTRLSKPLLREIFKTHHKTGQVVLPKQFEPIARGMAERRAFAAIDLPAKAKRQKVSKMLERLHATGRISFKGETRVVFSRQAIAEINKILAPCGPEFMRTFRTALREETGWVRDYLHRKGEHIIKKEWKE